MIRQERSVFFACKAGMDPVQVPNKSAHTRLPWVAQGFEVFEWVVETRGEQHWVNQTIDERGALYRHHGLDFYARNPVLNWAMMSGSIVDKILWREILGEDEKEEASLAQALAALRAKTEQIPGNTSPPAAMADA